MHCPLPLVGIPASMREGEGYPFHRVGDRNCRAIAVGANAVPVMIPALGDDIDPNDLICRLNGLLLTGSPANVEPHHYGGEPSLPGTQHDPHRDATSLPLIRACLKAGIPILAICLGIQELNVAMGGSLHQRIHALPGRFDHRSPKNVEPAIRTALAHTIAVTPGGLVEELALQAGLDLGNVEINSLHAQGIDRVADGLVVEAVAPDGTIEAVRAIGAPALGIGRISQFVLGVQWHPEAMTRDDPLSAAIFRAFGDAVRAHAAARDGTGQSGPVVNAAE